MLSGPAPAPALDYPDALRGEVIDTLHGVAVPDPYRWLEDIDSPEAAGWIAAQNAVTDAYMETVPAREAIRARLEALWDYERIGVPRREGERLFFTKQSGLQNQSVLFTQMVAGDGASGDERPLLDPNTLSEDGTVALAGYAVSPGAEFLAYSLQRAGSDWQEWRVREVATGRDLDDLIEWAKFSGASWSRDGEGFCYGRFDEPAEGEKLSGVNYFHKLFYHRLGTPQSEDVLLYERPDEKKWGFNGHFTEDGAYLVVNVWSGTFDSNGIIYRKTGTDDWVELFLEFEAEYDYVGNDGATFYFKTNNNAPLGRLVAVDLENPAADQWRELIAESKHKLDSVSLVGDTFIATHLVDAQDYVTFYDLAGARLRELETDGPVSVGGFSGRRDDTETFYMLSGFTRPPTIFRYDIGQGAGTLYRAPEVAFEPDAFESQQVFYTSKDGTRIPMTLAFKRGLQPGNSDLPVYLYGYGGFNISLTPRFSLANILWMEAGGVFAQANLRGGGEYGEAWHDAGRRANKQNVFDDFIAAGEWLIAQGYTRAEKLAIGGRSNGGLLAAACLVQRPDLFGAADVGVGVLDMLRFHQFTIGWAWQDEYGEPDKEDDFGFLIRYSPYHNIKPGTRYPATLISTADHDDRVFPAHSFKFAAALQQAQAEGGPPVLIRIETKAGHGAGKPTAKLIDEVADRWAFIGRALGVEWGAVPSGRE
ncbi:prolyl oligopeptidase family serine peptidase [soil metagenome]